MPTLDSRQPESTFASSGNHGSRLQQRAGGLATLCAQLHERIISFLQQDTDIAILKKVQEQTRISLDVIEEALHRYKFEELCISYNGGKDCLVLLVVYLAALHAHYTPARTTKSEASVPQATSQEAPKPYPDLLKSVYIRPAHPFEEVDRFVQTSAMDYQLRLVTSSKPMKEAFAEYLSNNTEVKAIFVGTRRTDPHGGSLTHFDPTDRGWPSFMRIHPVIDWHYQEIWAFIRHLQIPYCSLYDRGYTSLGGTNDTNPNPRLGIANKTPSGETRGPLTFRPAYELQDDDQERLGRE